MQFLSFIIVLMCSCEFHMLLLSLFQIFGCWAGVWCIKYVIYKDGWFSWKSMVLIWRDTRQVFWGFFSFSLYVYDQTKEMHVLDAVGMFHSWYGIVSSWVGCECCLGFVTGGEQHSVKWYFCTLDQKSCTTLWWNFLPLKKAKCLVVPHVSSST